MSSIIGTTTPRETPTGQFEKKVGTNQEVWAGVADITKRRKLTKDQLVINDKGNVVSKQASQSAKNRSVRTATALGPQFGTLMKPSMSVKRRAKTKQRFNL